MYDSINVCHIQVEAVFQYVNARLKTSAPGHPQQVNPAMGRYIYNLHKNCQCVCRLVHSQMVTKGVYVFNFDTFGCASFNPNLNCSLVFF